MTSVVLILSHSEFTERIVMLLKKSRAFFSPCETIRRCNFDQDIIFQSHHLVENGDPLLGVVHQGEALVNANNRQMIVSFTQTCGFTSI